MDSIDPNVQVAFLSLVGTGIITLGVVVVAYINNRKERGNAASAGVEAGLDERDVLERMLSLIAENERKEETIASLKRNIRERETKIRELMRENTALRLESTSLEET